MVLRHPPCSIVRNALRSAFEKSSAPADFTRPMATSVDDRDRSCFSDTPLAAARVRSTEEDASLASFVTPSAPVTTASAYAESAQASVRVAATSMGASSSVGPGTSSTGVASTRAGIAASTLALTAAGPRNCARSFMSVIPSCRALPKSGTARKPATARAASLALVRPGLPGVEASSSAQRTRRAPGYFARCARATSNRFPQSKATATGWPVAS